MARGSFEHAAKRGWYATATVAALGAVVLSGAGMGWQHLKGDAAPSALAENEQPQFRSRIRKIDLPPERIQQPATAVEPVANKAEMASLVPSFGRNIQQDQGGANTSNGPADQASSSHELPYPESSGLTSHTESSVGAGPQAVAPGSLARPARSMADENGLNIHFGPPFAEAKSAPKPSPEAAKLRKVRIEVKSGDSLYSILLAQKIPGSIVPALISNDPHGKRLKRIHPGQSLDLHLTAAGTLQRLDFMVDETTTLSYVREGDAFGTELRVSPFERRKAQVTGTIQSSLFLDGQRAGLSNRVVMQMSHVFGWDVDFALDLRRGDQFTVVYEELYLNGRKIRDGDILAAEFVNQNNVYRAVRFVGPDGVGQFYTPEGLSMRKAFLRTPVKFARISSRFNLRRKHPILHKFRAHRGVDYAASTGTPIKATGYGKIEFLGRKGGYGNTVVVRHGSGYTTLYAHMHKFRRGLKQGSTIKQGQVIGYVGKTGLATGPHLHYEFRVNGHHKDPLRVKLPKSLPIGTKLRRRFREQTHKLVAMLDIYSRTSVAMR